MVGSKFSIKMLEKCDFNEKERVKENCISLKTKTLERFVEENNKNGLDWIGQKRIVIRVLSLMLAIYE